MRAVLGILLSPKRKIKISVPQQRLDEEDGGTVVIITEPNQCLLLERFADEESQKDARRLEQEEAIVRIGGAVCLMTAYHRVINIISSMTHVVFVPWVLAS